MNLTTNIPHRGNANTSYSGCTSCKSKDGCNKLNVFDLFKNTPTPSLQKEDSGFVEIRFKNTNKAIYFNDKNLYLEKGDVVNVKDSVGFNAGIVSATEKTTEKIIRKKNLKQKLDKEKTVIKKLSHDEIKDWVEYIKKEEEYLLKVRSILKKFDSLDIKISDFELNSDKKRGIVYFVSKKRIDFRDFVARLSKELGIKIEMRQIGSRQEAAWVGGIGSCGRELCCSTWITQFKTVNINSVKYQQLSINTEKITGLCGKLKCCLNYELSNYSQVFKNFPNRKTKLLTKAGKASLQKIDVLNEYLWYAYDESPNDFYKISLKKTLEIITLNKNGKQILELTHE